MVLSACWKQAEDITPVATSEEISSVDYYDQLLSTCNQADKVCCTESIETMRKNSYKEYNYNACPGGLRPNDQKCVGTKVWCEPDTFPL